MGQDFLYSLWFVCVCVCVCVGAWWIRVPLGEERGTQKVLCTQPTHCSSLSHVPSPAGVGGALSKPSVRGWWSLGAQEDMSR